jgi:hypothetical protein
MLRHGSITNFACSILLITVAGPAIAQDGTDAYDDEVALEAYCGWVRAQASSRASLLVSPDVFGIAGPTASGFEETGDEYQAYKDVDLRVTAGIQYRFANLHRGVLARQVGEAECDRYEAQQQLKRLLELGDDIGKQPAIEAQLDVLQEAIPRGEALVELLEQGLELNFATVEELYGARLQVDGLRKQVRALRQESERLQRMPEAGDTPLDERLRSWSDADDELVRLDGRIRKASAWNVDLRGGYDQLLGEPRDIPAFAQLRVSYNLGGFGQIAAERKAREARATWRGVGSESLQHRVETLRFELLALRDAEVERLAEVAPLMDDVSGRLHSLESVDTDRSRKVREELWLDFVRLDAERAFIETHIAELDRQLGLPPSTGGGSAASAPIPAPAPEGARLAEFKVTSGKVGQVEPGRLEITAPKVRAVLRKGGADVAEARFVYLGPTEETTALGSGAVRQQLGLKLRAIDGCNLVYVMWRFEPESKIAISVKLNPGQSTHAQCGNGGYTQVAYIDVPPVVPGEPHVLRASMDGRELTVWADGEEVWRGELDEAVQDFTHGHVGFRSDNTHFEMEFLGGE